MSSDADYTAGEESEGEVSLDYDLNGSKERKIKAERSGSEGSIYADDQEEISSQGEESPGGISDLADDSAEDDQSPTRKHAAQDGLDMPRPFKRRPGNFNGDYMDLLNDEIEDAAQQVGFQDDLWLEDSQIGLAFWTAEEKDRFFAALARLGRFDLPGIAASVGGKSVVEVRHYLGLLSAGGDVSHQNPGPRPFEITDYPAAAEFGVQCCVSQEKVADALALKVERRQQLKEQRKWGKAPWDVTASRAVRLNKRADLEETNAAAYAQLFHLPRWIELSQEVFMNSSIQRENWTFIDDRPPSVWATAFEDFHSLAVSITRRMVQTCLFVAMSRIRARNLTSTTSVMVTTSDVEAAVASLGMSSNARQFWQKSARRLRLAVYKNPSSFDETDELEPMTYDAVERELSDDVEPAESIRLHSPQSSNDNGISDDSEEEGEDEHYSSAAEDDDVGREIDEALYYSVANVPRTQETKAAFRSQILAAKLREQHAEAIDAHDSYTAENEMWWNILHDKPPLAFPKRQPPVPSGSSSKAGAVRPSTADWAVSLEYHAEWERPTLP